MEQLANKRCEASNEPPMWLANLDAIRNELSGAASEQIRGLFSKGGKLEAETSLKMLG